MSCWRNTEFQSIKHVFHAWKTVRKEPRTGLSNVWHAGRFPRHAPFTAVLIFIFVLSVQRLYIVKNMCNICKSPFQRGSNSSPNYSHIFYLIAFLEEDFIRSIICYILSIICINNNNAVISNNSVKHQDLILIFRIPMGTRENIFAIYGQFGHAPSKRFTNPGL